MPETETVTEVEEADTEESDARELEHQLLLANTELARLRPLQLQDTIRQAGFEPKSPAGRVLAELAAQDINLARDVRALRRKAAELGLTAEPSPATPRATAGSPSAAVEVWWDDPDLTDTRFPVDHPRNQTGSMANRRAQREARSEKNAFVMSDPVHTPVNLAFIEDLQKRIADAEAADAQARRTGSAAPGSNPGRLVRQLKGQLVQALSDESVDGTPRTPPPSNLEGQPKSAARQGRSEKIADLMSRPAG